MDTPSAPGGLSAEDVERLRQSQLVQQADHPLDAEGADQFVLEVVVADVETVLGHVVRLVDRQPFGTQRAKEERCLTGVAEAEDGRGVRRVQLGAHVTPDVGRSAHVDQLDEVRLERGASHGGRCPQGGDVAAPLEQHHHRVIHGNGPGGSHGCHQTVFRPRIQPDWAGSHAPTTVPQTRRQNG